MKIKSLFKFLGIAPLAAVSLLVGASTALAQATVGQPAPAFTATDTDGRTHSLSDFAGRYVVLEWINPGCPFVRKHYQGNMQDTQRMAAQQNVAWLAVSSTAPGFADYLEPAKLGQWMSEHNAAATATLMDDDGTIGRAYGARVTPHMYIINPEGTLVYAGAIDSIPSARVEDIAKATNFVKQSLGELLAGETVSQANTRAYGCTIKYAS